MSVQAVDMRLRPPLPQWTGGAAFKTAMWYARQGPGFLGARSAWLESMDELLSEMNSAGVRYGVIMGRAAFSDLGNFDNKSIVDALDRWPNRFVGFLGVDLENIDASLREVRELATHRGIKGISIEPGSAKTPRLADDAVLSPIYETAGELGLPISISLSGLLSALAGHDLSWCSPIPVQRVAFRFPQLTIIVSHAAWPRADEMVAIALASPNIYVSPDVYISTAYMPCAQTYVDAANLFLGDRTLWGTAYPSRGHIEAMRDVRTFNWTPGTLDKVLWDNPARLLGL
jgi:hypothetical protein